MIQQTQFKDLVQSELARIEHIVFEKISPKQYDYSNKKRHATLLARVHKTDYGLFRPLMRFLTLL